ncbi:MAG: hypothetical protein J6W13_11985 [Salinivirgaceae bacterium]|nr:hypothetical protein [Salinivirgaceae bacterium]
MEKRKGYKWQFANIGGTPRVCIKSGEDIAHLGELDQKLWTVLSCPIKGLELDAKTLEMLDIDNDGKIRVPEVVETAEWLTAVLKDNNLLLKKSDKITLDDINQETEDGKRVYASAKRIIENLGLKDNTITIDNTADSIAIFSKTRFNGDGIITADSTDDADLKATIEACIKTMGALPDRSGADGVDTEKIEAFYANCTDWTAWLAQTAQPYGDDTAAVVANYQALNEKVTDYFMRCKLAAFDGNATDALNVSAEQFAAISSKVLAAGTEEISAYPLARIANDGLLPLDLNAINPAWQAQFNVLINTCFKADFAKKKAISEADWKSIGEKIAPYTAWLADKKGTAVEGLGIDVVSKILADNRKAELLALVEQDKALESEANAIHEVDKLLHMCRDFYTMLKNFVTLNDFYTKGSDTMAIFQAGTLYIDQRSCDLCLKVSDMDKHAAMASFSGMFLIYCDCRSKRNNDTMKIVAAMTNGEVNNLTVGKNAIFYDRNGLDWDTTVTKIIENPISIRQAFWSPYRRISVWIENMINKRAAEKDAKFMEETTAKLEAKATADGEKPAATPPFDIAKFAGIFAAIGMALGMIGTALATVAKGISGFTWYQYLAIVVGIIVVISGPSMIMAWLKLRKRNLAQVLNANGWAVNADILVNIIFGATLTKIAKYPKVRVKDPFAEKGVVWKRIMWAVILLAAIFAGLYFTNKLERFGLPYGKKACAEKVEQGSKASEDSTNCTNAEQGTEDSSASADSTAVAE